ncbi:MAG: hypothetical protein ACRDFB_00700 [Rhabdochlamydiaceae bacterium]
MNAATINVLITGMIFIAISFGLCVLIWFLSSLANDYTIARKKLQQFARENRKPKDKRGYHDVKTNLKRMEQKIGRKDHVND